MDDPTIKVIADYESWSVKILSQGLSCFRGPEICFFSGLASRCCKHLEPLFISFQRACMSWRHLSLTYVPLDLEQEDPAVTH